MHAKPDLRVFLKWMIARSGSVITDVIPVHYPFTMTVELPEISDHPLIMADDLRFYISRRLKTGDLDLHSAFLLLHEAVRIGRIGYLQSAWGKELSISGLLRIYMNGLMASAFGITAVIEKSREWLVNDMKLLASDRKHYFTSEMRKLKLFNDVDFLKQLSDIRQNYETLNDDNGPYHTECFPWHYAAPERELLDPNSDKNSL